MVILCCYLLTFFFPPFSFFLLSSSLYSLLSFTLLPLLLLHPLPLFLLSPPSLFLSPLPSFLSPPLSLLSPLSLSSLLKATHIFVWTAPQSQTSEQNFWPSSVPPTLPTSSFCSRHGLVAWDSTSSLLTLSSSLTQTGTPTRYKMKEGHLY